MTGHKFSDDVAVCKAVSLQQAKKKFERFYSDIKDDEIVNLTQQLKNEEDNNTKVLDVIILTDY